jgi:hypothetical protein
MKRNAIEMQSRKLHSYADQMAANLHFPFQDFPSIRRLPNFESC